MHDVLSDIFRLIRLKSCVYFMEDFCAPWGMRIGRGEFAQFHLVVRGSCVVEADGRTLEINPGDVLLFPRGAAHTLADRPGRATASGMAVVEAISNGTPLFAEGDTTTRLLCGHFEYDNALHHPIIEELPDLIHVASTDDGGADLFGSLVPLLLREMSASQPGARTVVERLAEVLLVHVLRLHFHNAGRPVGFLAAIAEERLARAIHLIHSCSHQRLTLDDLARSAGMSRSAFALKFRSVSNHSPIAYLTIWRMFRAREILLTTSHSLVRLAEQVGYESEVAFSRAFKRQFGCSPSELRRTAVSDAP